MSTLPPPPPVDPTPGPSPRAEATGFFSALFDFSFDTFITPKLVKVMYLLALVGIGLYLFFAIAVSFQADAAFGIGMLIISPILGLFILAMVRMTLEFYLATVRMSEDIHKRLPPA